ncbi:hypothetical protein [Nakamurella deserti]|uniref:hypothetical protein n=1 Tax=Nakamurella deserti TaxID=2164074 RepID=UPI00130082B9|nr:hypothetical protein [Nakamurella deserti]
MARRGDTAPGAAYPAPGAASATATPLDEPLVDLDGADPDLPGGDAPPSTPPAPVVWWVRSEVPLYLLSVVLTCIATVHAMGLLSADLRAPFVYSNDATAVLAHFQTVINTGWYEFTPQLGAPIGQTYHDFPQADNLHMMLALVMSLFTDNAALAVNVWYLLGFPLAAVASVWLFRRIGVGKLLSLVLSVLYAITPFHWEKGENHLFLAAYFPVPLALVLVFWIIRGESVWGSDHRPADRRPRWLSRLPRPLTGRGAVTVLVLALLGTASSYFSVFLLLMIGTAGLIALLRTRDRRRFLGAVLAGGTLVAVMLANMLPDILYSAVNGNNVGALVRYDNESERFALKIAQLILPAPDHALAPLRDLRQWYDATYPYVSERPALGLVGAVGFLGLLGHILVRLGTTGALRAPVRNSVRAARHRRNRETLGYLALLTLVALLFSTIGGLETIVSFLTQSLRSWNRLAILISAFALAAVGLAVDALLRRVARRHPRRVGHHRLTAGVVAAALLLVGVYDQSTHRAEPDYATVAAQWNADQLWIDRLEAALPDGAMVFQLAYQAFPEANSINGVVYTDQLKPFLHSSTLRWSGGAIRGRAENDWPLLVAAEKAPQLVADVAVAGFEGIMVDRRTYADGGATLEAALEAALGVTGPDMVSASTRYAYYGLTGERERLVATYSPAELSYARDTVLEPVFLYAGADYDLGQNASKQTLWTSKDPTAALILDNARGAAVPVSLSMVLTSPSNATQVMLTSGSQSWVVNLSSAAASAITLDFDAMPGRTDFTLSPGPDARNVDGNTSFAVAKVSVVDKGRPDLAAACSGLPGSGC